MANQGKFTCIAESSSQSSLSFIALFSAHSCVRALWWLSHHRVMGRHVCSLVNFSPHFIKAVETKHRATTSTRLVKGEPSDLLTPFSV